MATGERPPSDDKIEANPTHEENFVSDLRSFKEKINRKLREAIKKRNDLIGQIFKGEDLKKAQEKNRGYLNDLSNIPDEAFGIFLADDIDNLSRELDDILQRHGKTFKDAQSIINISNLFN